jgi:3-oxoacyl-[acyl-carrier-protein] synthase II
MPNLATGFVSIKFNAEGPSRAPCTACAAASQAISDAVDDIRSGRTDVMIAGGTEAPQSDVPPVVGGFGAIRAFTPSDYDDPPEAASRPFDEDRSGFLMSEGTGVLTLESREHAEQREAEILAEITGAGLASDASHPTGPREDAASLSRAISAALADADVEPREVDHVNVHATSTPAGDEHEALALNKAFETVPPVTANKSLIGHTGAACGAIEAAISTLTIANGVIPPTINVDNQDPACDVPVVTERREAPVERVVTNSAGFGGLNASLVIEGS